MPADYHQRRLGTFRPIRAFPVMTDPAQFNTPSRPRRTLSAVFLFLGIVVGGGLVALWVPHANPPPAPAAPTAQVTQAIRDLQAGQQKAADQLQTIQQTLSSDQDQIKQLSGNVAAIGDKLEALRQSFASSQQAAPPAMPASGPANRRNRAR